jgi:hypothetical protein
MGAYNWDDTFGPVAHQWDRGKHLHGHCIRDLFKQWYRQFAQEHGNEKERYYAFGRI